jgi:hypothetical protein
MNEGDAAVASQSPFAPNPWNRARLLERWTHRRGWRHRGFADAPAWTMTILGLFFCGFTALTGAIMLFLTGTKANR